MGGEERRFGPEEITVDSIYVMLRDDSTGELRCEYEPIAIDEGEIAELNRLAGEVRAERERLVEILESGLEEIYAEYRADKLVRAAGTEHRLVSWLGYLGRDTRLLEPLAGQLGLLEKPMGQVTLMVAGKREAPICPLFSAPYDSWGFEVPSNERIASVLEADQAEEAAEAAARLSRARAVVDAARESYRDTFNAYISAIESLFPGITSFKDYCPVLDDAHVELDYEIAPTNTRIVDDVTDYYRAQRHEEAIAAISGRKGFVCCSARRLGFMDRVTHQRRSVVATLDQGADLKWLVDTNFGYGGSSYFYSTLSFMGFNVLNADLAVFYSFAQLSELIRATHVFEVEEASYKRCFDLAVDYQRELRSMGAGAFADKYVKGPVERLANLMHVIARSCTFLRISSLSLFSSLTRSGASLVMPGTHLEESFYRLCEPVSSLVAGFAASIRQEDAPTGGPGLTWDQGLAKELERAVGIGSDPETIASQLAQRDLARQALVSRIRERFGDADWAVAAADEVLPMPGGCELLTLDGYDLLSFRGEKASLILSLLKHSAETLRGTSCREAINSMLASCELVGDQCAEFLRSDLEPERSRLIREGLRVSAEIQAIEALPDEASLADRLPELESLGRERESLRERLSQCNCRRKSLETYARRLKDLDGLRPYA